MKDMEPKLYNAPEMIVEPYGEASFLSSSNDNWTKPY